MESKEMDINFLEKKWFALARISKRIELGNVFRERSCEYLNELHLFMAHFNSIPNVISEKNIDCKKAGNWLKETFKNEIKDWYFNKRYFGENKKCEFDDVFYFLNPDLLVNFDTNSSQVRFLFKKTSISKVEEIISCLKKFRKRKQRRKPGISLLISSRGSIDTKEMEISKPKLKIEDNYNDDFKEIHETILKSLSKKNDKGLVLLHGKPGTGKTSYIRYLISLSKKNIIFLPPNMASAITNPDLMSVLTDNPNSIFIIEDAENIIIDREKDGHSPVSALLNISDGLLSDCLNIQIICSFNTDISKVDNALMRKGRLIAKYEFKELEREKAQSLSNKLGFNSIINLPMTLSGIYNQDEKDFQHQNRKNSIGFRAA